MLARAVTYHRITIRSYRSRCDHHDFLCSDTVISLMNIIVPLQTVLVMSRSLSKQPEFLVVCCGRDPNQYVTVALVNLAVQVGWLIRHYQVLKVPWSRWTIDMGAANRSGVGTTLTGVNFFATILRMRTRLCQMMKHVRKVHVGALCAAANILIIISFLILPLVTIALLTLDRYIGTKFLHQWSWWQREDDVCEPDLGMGTPRGARSYPSASVFSEVTATLTQKAIWLHLTGLGNGCNHYPCVYRFKPHHFSIMGSGANVNASWYRKPWLSLSRPGLRFSTGCSPCTKGRIRFTTPMLTVGFLITFTVGGSDGRTNGSTGCRLHSA